MLLVRDESALAVGNEALGEVENRHNVAHRSNGEQYYKILLHTYTSAPLLNPLKMLLLQFGGAEDRLYRLFQCCNGRLFSPYCACYVIKRGCDDFVLESRPSGIDSAR